MSHQGNYYEGNDDGCGCVGCLFTIALVLGLIKLIIWLWVSPWPR